MQVLNLSSSGIKGSLPLTWGSNGALPALVELDLSNNTITGEPHALGSTHRELQMHFIVLD